MSAEALIASMQKLYKLHQSLHELALKKTEVVKTGDMEALNKSLKDEQSHLAAIEKVENERQASAAKIAPGLDRPTVTDCFDYVTDSEREQLIEVTNSLAETIFDLKEQNYLNQQLIHHSLQFVNLSMNLLHPRPDNINYGPPQKKGVASPTQGMFNSKV